MAGKILLEVVTPEKQLLSQQVDEVIAPGSEGEFGVLPGHCYFLSALRIGEAVLPTEAELLADSRDAERLAGKARS